VLGGEDVENRLRLSKAEARKYAVSREVGFGLMPLHEVAYRHGETIAQSALLFRAAMSEQPVDGAELTHISTAACATFPIKASDLIADYQGPALGEKIAELEQVWIDSGFTLRKNELLNHG
jgi:poly(A) polymerase/tRNA nucleotidyltransferase (CCA-adding enzyme)